MSSITNVRPSPLIALGVSAIDLLCCAFVSALVMFLVLASPQVAEQTSRGTSGIDTGITIKYQVETADAIIALRFIVDDGDADPVDFISSQAQDMAIITNSRIRNALVEPAGLVFESKTPGVILSDGSPGYDYVYKLSRLHPQNWDIRFAYSDTGRDIAAAVPPIARVSVYVRTTCSVQLMCEIPVGESRSLTDSDCKKVSANACDIPRILRDIAHPAVQSHADSPAAVNL
jgi:hypothetical protein